jgi:aromatic ring-opening dioxygenase LigB subunit
MATLLSAKLEKQHMNRARPHTKRPSRFCARTLEEKQEKTDFVARKVRQYFSVLTQQKLLIFKVSEKGLIIYNC